MDIQQAALHDVPEIDTIYEEARRFMRERGNHKQWTGGYPDRSVIESDIEKGQLFVVRDEGGILGVFVYFHGEDPTYRVIEDGSWLSPLSPYGVLHRVAIAHRAHRRGVGSLIFRYALARSHNVRIDTHEDNQPMRHSLEKHGFSYRGIIYLASGESRLAYQCIES